MAPMEGLGERVRTLRREAGITQADLAARACLSRRTVARIEAGYSHANRSTLRLIAEALGVDTDELTADEAA